MPKDLIKGQQPFGAGEEDTEIRIVVEVDHISAVPSILLRGQRAMDARLSRIDPSSGALHPWKHLTPRDPTGVNAVTGVAITGDEQSYVYSYRRVLSELYVAEGWR